MFLVIPGSQETTNSSYAYKTWGTQVTPRATSQPKTHGKIESQQKKHTLGLFPPPSNREKQESSSFKYFWLVLYPVIHIFYLQLLTSLLGGDVSGITDLSDLLPVHPCRFWVLLRCVGKHRDLGLGMKTIVITKNCLLGGWKNDKTYPPNGGLMKWRWIPW